MRVGIASDHAGFELKDVLTDVVRAEDHTVVDFGARQYDRNDDYPDFVVLLAEAIRAGEVDRGIALCGSGVGVCIAANKIPCVRAALIHDVTSSRQGVEDEDMNLLCLGAWFIERDQAVEIVRAFLTATFSGEERHRRRLRKIAALEHR